MNFGFTAEQELLAAAVQKFLREHSPLGEVRRAARSEHGYSESVWRTLSELGWPGLLVPEAHGGSGLGFVDAALLFEQLGYGLLPGPLAATVLASAALAAYGSAAQQAQYLPGLARGASIAAPALFEDGQPLEASGVHARAQAEPGGGFTLSGEKAFVPDAGSAELFVVAARSERGLGLFLVERGQPGVSTSAFATIDATKRMGSLSLSQVRVADSAVLVAPPAGEAAYARLLDQGAISIAAESIGAGAAALAMTVEYAKTRRQFEAPIGKFQGVKHPLAEAHVELETARSLVYYAAWTLDASPSEAPRAAAMAKAYASEAFATIGLLAIQLHGAIGYTEEYDAQLYFKRSKWARPQYGDPDQHYERIAQLGGL
jgi:alkylation response protein AidB-like acyl-CoA dehydrogenase